MIAAMNHSVSGTSAIAGHGSKVSLRVADALHDREQVKRRSRQAVDACDGHHVARLGVENRTPDYTTGLAGRRPRPRPTALKPSWSIASGRPIVIRVLAAGTGPR